MSEQLGGTALAGTGSGAGVPRWIRFGHLYLVLCITVVALLYIAIYSWAGFDDVKARGSAFGYLGLVGAAGAFAGAFFGFLFGVPRTATSGSGTTAPGAGPAVAPAQDAATGSTSSGGNGAAVSVAPNVTGDPTQPNTNLEQISDWLTKILVGATLTQLGAIPSAATRLFRGVSQGLGNQTLNEGFVGSLIIYSALSGFMLGWFTARVWVGPVITTIAAYLKNLSDQVAQNAGAPRRVPDAPAATGPEATRADQAAPPVPAPLHPRTPLDDATPSRDAKRPQDDTQATVPTV